MHGGGRIETPGTCAFNIHSIYIELMCLIFGHLDSFVCKNENEVIPVSGDSPLRKLLYAMNVPFSLIHRARYYEAK